MFIQRSFNIPRNISERIICLKNNGYKNKDNGCNFHKFIHVKIQWTMISKGAFNLLSFENLKKKIHQKQNHKCLQHCLLHLKLFCLWPVIHYCHILLLYKSESKEVFIIPHFPHPDPHHHHPVVQDLHLQLWQVWPGNIIKQDLLYMKIWVIILYSSLIVNSN
jgi:hypothetical protein